MTELQASLLPVDCLRWNYKNMGVSRKVRHKLLFLMKPFYDFVSILNPYPNSFRNELLNKIELLKNTTHLNMGGVFIFFSDFHANYNAKHSDYVIRNIVEETDINKVFYGGDTITLSEKTLKKAIKVHNSFLKKFSFLGEKLFLIYGNHDDNTHGQKNKKAVLPFDYLAKIINNNKNITSFGKYSYYFDDDNQKTRYVCLDTGKRYLENTENEIISSVLNTVKSGWHIIILTHIVFEYIEKKYQPKEHVKSLLELFDMYNARKLGTRIECIIGAHIHNDFVSRTEGGIPIVLVDSDAYLFSTNRFVRKRMHLSEQCVTVFMPDYENNAIRTVRFGYGEDRIIKLNAV